MSAATIKRRDYATTTRLWGKCACGCRWQWNGKTEHATDGEAMILASGCFCPDQRRVGADR